MKKVLYVITKSNWGGAQRYVFDLATALPKEEFDVVVALGGNGPLKQKLEAEGIRTLGIGGLQRDISLTKELSAYRELVHIFTTVKPDIVHLNSTKAGGLGALAARISGIKTIVFTAHGWPFGEKRSFAVRAALWLVSWITALCSHKIICVSEHDLQAGKRLPFVGNKMIRIYNGIDLHTPLGSGEVIRSAFPTGVQITGTIGELNKNKNHIALIKEAHKNTNMYVAIVGEGELREFLEQKIKEYCLGERVKLFGFLPSSGVLKGFDTFALPSLKEGLPYVLLEARAAGLPLRANRVGGIGEILDAKDMNEFTLEKMVTKTLTTYKS